MMRYEEYTVWLKQLQVGDSVAMDIGSFGH